MAYRRYLQIEPVHCFHVACGHFVGGGGQFGGWAGGQEQAGEEQGEYGEEYAAVLIGVLRTGSCGSLFCAGI